MEITMTPTAPVNSGSVINKIARIVSFTFFASLLLFGLAILRHEQTPNELWTTVAVLLILSVLCLDETMRRVNLFSAMLEGSIENVWNRIKPYFEPAPEPERDPHVYDSELDARRSNKPGRLYRLMDSARYRVLLSAYDLWAHVRKPGVILMTTCWATILMLFMAAKITGV